MFFYGKVDYWGKAVLKHDSVNLSLYLDLAQFGMRRKKVDENTIKSFINEYRLLFLNHFIETSHLVNFINTSKMAIDQKDDFFNYLLAYIKQFYSDVDFFKNIDDVPSLTKLFDRCYDKIDSLITQTLDDRNLECVKRSIDEYNRIIKFYSIITDFLIRFYGYSIIGLSSQKHIITASSNCDQKFIDQLMQGYSLFRLQKIGVADNCSAPDEIHYDFFPVLPTKDIGIPFDEYIEVSGSDNKIDSKTMIKLPHWS